VDQNVCTTTPNGNADCGKWRDEVAYYLSCSSCRLRSVDYRDYFETYYALCYYSVSGAR